MKANYGRRILASDYEISNDTRVTGLNNNDLIIGATGSGKTGGYVIPNLQITDHSMVISDTKRNLCKKFKSSLESRGFRVEVIDFVTPENSCAYNPIDNIRVNPDGSYREQDIAIISRCLVPAMDASEPFWEMAARTYMSFLIAYMLETTEPAEHNLATVMRLHTRYCHKANRLDFDLYAKKHPATLASRIYSRISASDCADKMWGSILEFATEALTPFEYREMQVMFTEGRFFDIRSLGREKTILFINQSDTDHTFTPVVNLFMTQLFQLLCREADEQPDSRLKVPVRVMLDDFATGAAIPDFDKLISVIRSREIYVSIILQSISQLDSVYASRESGRSASRTIINNCDTILFLGGQDEETEHFVAKKCLKTEDTIHTKPREKAYLMVAGQIGRLTDKIRPYSTLEAENALPEREAEHGV